MSDSYIAIIPTVTSELVEDLSKKAVDWLTRREIISSEITDCVLGQQGGHSPGPKFKSIIDGDDFGLLGLRTNGLEVINERRVFDSGENELEEIICRHCRANNINSDWQEAIGLWHSGENESLKCKQCGKSSPITDYGFNPTWAFGEFELIFWNWPKLKDEFLDNFKRTIYKDIKVIYGRV